jgi:hypothetical protein
MSDGKPMRIFTEATNSEGGVWAFAPYSMTHVVFVEESDYLALQARTEKAQAEAAALRAEVERLRGALGAMVHAVCGETGFAACVRANAQLAYPWPALDAAEELARAALAKEGQ